MHTQQQAQEIFNVLVTELKYANSWNLLYVTRHLNNWHASFTIPTPLEHFLKSTREELTSDDVSDEFLSRVYAEAFHTGPIPENRNHISMTCDLQVNSGPKSPALSFWIDLDKVAAQLNTHLRTNPPYRFEVKYHASSSGYGTNNGGAYFFQNISSAVNSVQNTSSIRANFLFGCIVSGFVSFYAFVIAALAVASIITLNTAGILTAVGVGVVAAGASYCFFKASSGVNTTVTPIEESSAENIEDLFKNHFAETIGITIFPETDVEIIPDTDGVEIISEADVEIINDDETQTLRV